MMLNWIGVAAAAAAFFSIWLGHVGVRKIEAAAERLWLPAVAALGLGLGLEVAALLAPNHTLSAVLGIAGITLMWDALEFRRQHHRVARGHAPANPANPRHARLLGEGRGATTVDWLAREPAGNLTTYDGRPTTVGEG
jgi:hypothetical protein